MKNFEMPVDLTMTPVEEPADDGVAYEIERLVVESYTGTPLQRLAKIILELRYPDHMEFAKGIGADPDAVYKWAKNYNHSAAK